MAAPMLNLHILLVEHDAVDRENLVTILRGLGARHLVEVLDGAAALKAIASAPIPFDIVFADLEMEGMDGLEFIRHVAERGIGGLVLTSGLDASVLASAEWMARAYRVPLLGTLKKPLLVAAIAAMIGKAHGSMTVFSDVLTQCFPVADVPQRALEDLQDALNTGQFVPYYQPKVSLATGQMVGAEILVRWDRPGFGVLTPVQFLDLMESAGMGEALTYSVLGQACRDVLTWARRRVAVPLALNVSPGMLERFDSASRLLDLIVRGGVSRRVFTIEITEKAFATDVKALLENVLRLRMQGCRISVDDFGTGYSSLQQLHRVPVTELKLDRSFVRRMERDSKANSIVVAMLDLARNLSLSTVAEGIETDSQRRLLQGLGCKVGQGYLFGKPMDADTFLAWCEDRQRAVA